MKQPDPQGEAEKYKVRMSDEEITYLARQHGVSPHDICCICGMKIRTMSFKGTGVCGELHRKVRDNDTEPWQGGARNP